MSNVRQSRVSESGGQQNRTNNVVFVPPPPLPSQGLGTEEPIEIFAAGGSNEASLEAVGVTNEQTKTLEKGFHKDASPEKIIVQIVDPYEDVLKSLMPLAVEQDLFIVSASGTLSYVEVVNQPEAPVAETAFHGSLGIVFLEGRIVHPNRKNKNHKTEATILVTRGGGHLLGGPVQSLISKSPVQIILSTKSRTDLVKKAIEECPEGKEFGTMADMEKVGNQVYKETLKELNPSTST